MVQYIEFYKHCITCSAYDLVVNSVEHIPFHCVEFVEARRMIGISLTAKTAKFHVYELLYRSKHVLPISDFATKVVSPRESQPKKFDSELPKIAFIV